MNSESEGEGYESWCFFVFSIEQSCDETKN